MISPTMPLKPNKAKIYRKSNCNPIIKIKESNTPIILLLQGITHKDIDRDQIPLNHPSFPPVQ